MAHIQEKFDTSGAAKTGPGPTATVAIEQYFPSQQRIIHDDLALQILPGFYRFIIQWMRIPLLRNWIVKASEKQLRGIWGGMAVRKRYIDDKATAAVSGKSVQALVNLGAGYDTRVYRLPSLAAVPVWEADQPVNITAKQKGVEKALGRMPSHVTLVPINFMEQDLGAILAAHGYTPDTKTFFIWEAVSQYLTEAAVRRTFDFLALAMTGSHLVFTYVLKDFVEGSNLYEEEAFYKQMIVKARLWHFGFAPEEVADFLSEYGWRLAENLGYDVLGERYVKPTGRDLPAMAIERMVYAEKR